VSQEHNPEVLPIADHRDVSTPMYLANDEDVAYEPMLLACSLRPRHDPLLHPGGG
jgi:hypothetical protein